MAWLITAALFFDSRTFSIESIKLVKEDLTRSSILAFFSMHAPFTHFIENLFPNGIFPMRGRDFASWREFRSFSIQWQSRAAKDGHDSINDFEIQSSSHVSMKKNHCVSRVYK